jgi:superfamily II DNA or RNA helicase
MLASKLTGKAYGDYVPSSTIRISASGKIIDNSIEELKTDSKEVANNENPLKRNTNDLENRAKAMKRKNFKFDTIIKKKEASLFIIISTRYKAVISSNRVTIPIQRETISKEQRQRILGSFQELIKKL